MLPIPPNLGEPVQQPLMYLDDYLICVFSPRSTVTKTVEIRLLLFRYQYSSMYIENVEHMYLHVYIYIRLQYIFVEFYAMHMMFGAGA